MKVLRIRWVDDPSFLLPYGLDEPSDSPCTRALFSHKFNEIVLVRCNIWSNRALVYLVFHEFLHYLVYHLHLPRKLNRLIDKIDFGFPFLKDKRGWV